MSHRASMFLPSKPPLPVSSREDAGWFSSKRSLGTKTQHNSNCCSYESTRGSGSTGVLEVSTSCPAQTSRSEGCHAAMLPFHLQTGARHPLAPFQPTPLNINKGVRSKNIMLTVTCQINRGCFPFKWKQHPLLINQGFNSKFLSE